MTAPVDVAIIGGGIAGVASAFFLSRARLSVCLFEYGLIGAGASGVNFGGVRQQGRALAELPVAVRARELWSRLPELIGTTGEFTPSGHLKLARSDSDMAELERYAVQARDHGLALELVGRAALRPRYPWLASTLAGGSLCASDGHANPRLVAPALPRRRSSKVRRFRSTRTSPRSSMTARCSSCAPLRARSSRRVTL